MCSGRFLISLLHILTDGKVENVKKVNEQVDFDTKIIPSLEKSEILICINRKSFNRDNHDIFLIQIQIIFEIYFEKINQILKNEESKKATDINSDNLDSLTNAINYIINNPKKKITSLNELGTKIDLLVSVVEKVS